MGRTALQNCTFGWDIDPIDDFLGTAKSAPRTTSRSVQPFCRAHERDQQTDTQTNRARCFIDSNRPHLAIAVMWPKHFPLPLGIWTPSNTRFLWPTRVSLNGISMGSYVSAVLTNVTYRQTDRHADRPRYSTHPSYCCEAA